MGLFSALKGEKQPTFRKSSSGGLISTSPDDGGVPRIKSEFFPKRQAHFDVLSDSFEESWDESYDTGSNAAFIRTTTIGKSFSSATAPNRRDVLLRPANETPPVASPAGIEYTSINQFQQRVELYRGSISTVYRAVCSITQAPVIIKAYDKSKMKPKNFSRMEREIRLMRILGGGDGLVDLYAVFQDANFKYLVMEHCRGGDLFKTLMMKGGFLDEHWVCAEVIAPLLQVLTRMHTQNIIHRDIKPENIFLTSTLRFKLGDLGLAIKSDEELPFTRSGTLDYMAPEVLANQTSETQEDPSVTKAALKVKGIRPYDEKVDVWATGILAYECIVGKPPFEVNDEVQTATMIMYSNKINFPSKYSTQWADFVRQALEKKPHLRPSAAAMLDHPWIRSHVQGHLQETALESNKATAPTSIAIPETASSAPLPTNVGTSFGSAASFASSYSSTPKKLSGMSKGSTSLESGLVIHHPSASGGHMQGTEGNRLENEHVNLKSYKASPFENAQSNVGKIKAVFPLESEMAAASSKATLVKDDVLNGRGSIRNTLESITKAPSGLLPEGSGGSFMALLRNVSLHPPTYLDSSDVLDAADATKSGMRVRMKNYFNRQKGDL